MEKNQKNHAAPAAAASAIIWGSGQCMNRQYAKGALFFLAQIVFLILLPTILENINGLITLGDTAMVVNGSKVTQGDNSILLMLIGLLFVFVAVLFLFIYVFNIRDAYSQGKRIAEGKLVYTGKAWGKHTKDSSFPYLVLTPAIILVGLFVVIPIIFSFLIAFTNYASPDHLPPKNLVDWVGFKNFAMLVNMPMWNSTLLGVAAWTVIWAVGSTFSCFFGGLLVACLIESKRVKLKKFWRTLYILPWAIPGMISLLVFRNMFNGQFGAINTFLRNQGIISANIPWLSDATLAKVVIFVVNFWLGFPYFMALMSGIMTSIDTEVLDAAKVDGANERQVFRHVTLPIVMYQTAPLLIMSFANNFNNFNVIYFLTGGNPINPSYMYAGSTDILITWIYKLTTDNRQFNMASVMSILVFVVVASISTANFLRTKAFKEEDMLG